MSAFSSIGETLARENLSEATGLQSLNWASKYRGVCKILDDEILSTTSFAFHLVFSLQTKKITSCGKVQFFGC
jgi:hypothetical protein